MKLKKKSIYNIISSLLIIVLLLSQQSYYTTSFLNHSSDSYSNLVENNLAFDSMDVLDADDCEIDAPVFINEIHLLSKIKLLGIDPNYLKHFVIHHPFDVFTPPPQIDLVLS